MTKELLGSIPAASNIFFKKTWYSKLVWCMRTQKKTQQCCVAIISLKSKVLGQINLYGYVSEQTTAKLIQLLMLDVYA